jgi:predicted nuclease with TOPRIM domain
MERIYEVLADMQVRDEQLPMSIQNAIDDLDSKTIEFQKLYDALEVEGKNEDEIRQELGELDEQLEDYEDNIIENIERWYATQGNEPQYNNGGYVQQNKEKKKGGGMLLFGVFALVLTLGAVNVLKNK